MKTRAWRGQSQCRCGGCSGTPPAHAARKKKVVNYVYNCILIQLKELNLIVCMEPVYSLHVTINKLNVLAGVHEII